MTRVRHIAALSAACLLIALGGALGGGQRRAGHGVVAQLPAPVVEQVQGLARIPLQFLQRDDVGVEAAQDVGDASRLAPSVASHAAVDVVGGQAKLHAQCAWRGSGAADACRGLHGSSGGIAALSCGDCDLVPVPDRWRHRDGAAGRNVLRAGEAGCRNND